TVEPLWAVVTVISLVAFLPFVAFRALLGGAFLHSVYAAVWAAIHAAIRSPVLRTLVALCTIRRPVGSAFGCAIHAFRSLRTLAAVIAVDAVGPVDAVCTVWPVDAVRPLDSLCAVRPIDAIYALRSV